MNTKFESTDKFAEEWIEYKNIALAPQNIIILPEIRKIETPTDSIIYDLGCGDGELTSKLNFLNPLKVIGFDINKKLLRIAENLNIENYEFKYCDIGKTEIPVKSNSGSLIISNCLLMHLSDIELNNVLKESYRVLYNNGKVCFFVTHIEWAKLNYNLEELNSGSFVTSREIWKYNTKEYYRSNDCYKNYLIDIGFANININNLIIPNDKRLDKRYFSQAEKPLFSMIQASKKNEK